MILACALVASNVVLWLRAQDAQDRLDSVEHANKQTAQLIDCPSNPFATSSGFGGKDVCSRLDDLNSKVDDISSTLDENSVDGVQSEIDDMRDCINRYMETIARWSNNINSRYTYIRC